MTFSIVARDPETGALGVATATAGPAVGALVPHLRAGVGAVATQAMTNPYLALDGLELLVGHDAEAALAQVLAADPGRALRQVIMVDGSGRTAGWTGAQCEDHARHRLGAGVAVAGNILAGPSVLDAMLEGFAPPGPLDRRLLAAMTAGAAAGGDRRGLGSAAIKVATGEAYADIDLRIDSDAQPLEALIALHGRLEESGYNDFLRRIPRRHGPPLFG